MSCEHDWRTLSPDPRFAEGRLCLLCGTLQIRTHAAPEYILLETTIGDAVLVERKEP